MNSLLVFGSHPDRIAARTAAGTAGAAWRRNRLGAAYETIADLEGFDDARLVGVQGDDRHLAFRLVSITDPQMLDAYAKVIHRRQGHVRRTLDLRKKHESTLNQGHERWLIALFLVRKSTAI